MIVDTLTRLEGNSMFRLGLCCVFAAENIKFKTVTAHNLSKEKISNGLPHHYLSNLILSNLDSLKKAIAYCSANNIGSFRIGSSFFPLYTHPLFAYHVQNLPEAMQILQQAEACRQFAKENRIRLVFHPDQFVVLNSPSETVVQNSIAELEYHGIMAELLGADVINIHAGGVYGDKAASLKRLSANLEFLSPSLRQKLTLENDDKSYTPKDLLPLCLEKNVPLVYDVHHHRCLPDGLTVEEATEEALKTWNREPLFHISSPKEGWTGPQPSRHHDFIDIADFPICWTTIEKLTIEIEAKAKEIAIQKLLIDLQSRQVH